LTIEQLTLPSFDGDIFHMEGNDVDKEGCCVGAKVIRSEGERVESLVAEDGEGFHTVDACADFGVDIVSGEVVGRAQGGEGGDKGTKDLRGAVVGAAFGNGEGVVGGAKEADCLDNDAEEAREERGVGVEV
jgi:hypothetical protein